MILTGIVELNDGTNFHFLLENDTLILDPLDDETRKTKNVFTFNKSVHLFDEQIIKGVYYPDLKPIIFVKGSSVHASNSRWILKVRYVFQFNSGCRPIESLEVKAQELNFIYNVGKALDWSQCNLDKAVCLKPQNEIKTEKLDFTLKGKNVACSFGINKGLVGRNGLQTPLSLSTSLKLDFDATDDYLFIARLYELALDFIRFLCFRKNIKVDLANIRPASIPENPAPPGLLYAFSPVSVNDFSTDIENDKYVNYDSIEGHEHEIFKLLSENKIDIEYIPRTRADFVFVTPERYANVIRSFELLGKFLKNDGNTNDKRLNIQCKLSLVRKKYPELISNIHNKYISPDCKTLTGTIKTIHKVRNKLAHGDTDIFYSPEEVLSFKFLETLTYSLQLFQAGIQIDNVYNAVASIFELNHITPLRKRS